MNLITAPEPIELDENLSVFLAGSIEVGVGERWQDKVVSALKNQKVTVLNPRRVSWDASWQQEIENPQFYEQVNWELEALENADLIVMYFDKSTKSPITLLELGLLAPPKGIIPGGLSRNSRVVSCECHVCLHRGSSLFPNFLFYL